VSWLGALYPWIKSFHVIAVIAWMAGLLYLPRLFVYHCELQPGTREDKRFQLMERRLLRIIMNPAMVATYLFGSALALMDGAALWSSGWIYAKLALVALLTGAHHAMGRWRKGFAAGANRHSRRFYRFMNELPTLAMIGIVILVIVKPF
jgi:protoporphyrinogen IX oxidase